MAQNDTHVALIILTTQMWGGGIIGGKNFFRAKFCVPVPLAPTSVLTQNKGPDTEPHFSNPPPSFGGRPCHPPPPPAPPAEQFSGCPDATLVPTPSPTAISLTTPLAAPFLSAPLPLLLTSPAPAAGSGTGATAGVASARAVRRCHLRAGLWVGHTPVPRRRAGYRRRTGRGRGRWTGVRASPTRHGGTDPAPRPTPGRRPAHSPQRALCAPSHARRSAAAPLGPPRRRRGGADRRGSHGLGLGSVERRSVQGVCRQD